MQTFAMPWSKEALSYDILENDNAFVIVAEYEARNLQDMLIFGQF